MLTGRIALWAGILILAALALFSYLDPGANTAFAGPPLPEPGASVDDRSSSQACDQVSDAGDASKQQPLPNPGPSWAERIGLPAATDPSIAVALPSLSPSLAFATGVSGHTSPDVIVTMRLLRKGVQVGTGRTVSNYDGWYSFRGSAQLACRSTDYQWHLLPGDTVEVTAGGRTTVTPIAAPVVAHLDAKDNLVRGQTDPGRTVEVTLYQPAPDHCAPVAHKRSVTVSGDGTFTANFGGQVDVKNDAWATACIPDSGGNGVCWTANAYRLETEIWSKAVTGFVPQGQTFNLKVFRQGAELTTTEIWGSRPSGRFEVSVGSALLPGDRVEVDLGSARLESTLIELYGTLDLAQNRLRGSTVPGSAVRATAHAGKIVTPEDVYTTNGCDLTSRCMAGQASGDGQFELELPFDAQPGSWASLSVVDAQGNTQTRQITTRAISAYLNTKDIMVEWPAHTMDTPASTGSKTLKLSLFDAQNNLKGTQEAGIKVTESNFEQFVMPAMAAGDRIVLQANDGTPPETMRVGELSTRLNGATDTLTGQASQGRLTILPVRLALVEGGVLPDIRHLQRPQACTSTFFEGGAFERQFPPMGLSGTDVAFVSLQGEDGHYTSTAGRAFSTMITLRDLASGSIWVGGYTATVGSTVSVTSILGGVEKHQTVPTWEGGSFSLSLTYSGSLGSGDSIEFNTSDGDHYLLDLGAIVLPHASASDMLVCGKVPGPGSLQVMVGESAYPSGGGSVEGLGAADANGQYCVDLSRTGLPVESGTGDLCLPARTGSPCGYSRVEFMGADGNFMTFESKAPKQLDPDAFEEDDSYASPSYYAGPQHRTLTENDPDWVRFTVPPGPAGALMLMRVGNMGMGADITVSLYGGGGGLLETRREPNPTGQGLIWRKALSPGTYTLKIERTNPWGATACAFTYDLLIAPAKSVFLPVWRR